MKRLAIALTLALIILFVGVAVFLRDPYAELSAMVLAATTSQQPELLRKAVVAAESSIGHGGASFTDQLVKQATIIPSRTITRHLKEALLSSILNVRFSEEEILSGYLANVYLGRDIYGITSAARSYFGKRPDQLSLAESALLAGMIRSPQRYSPVAAPARAIQRRNDVLGRMRQRSFITQDAFDQAAREPLRTCG